MPVALAVGFGTTAVVLAVVLLRAWRIRHLERQRLASALIGEIAAILETIEMQELVAGLDIALTRSDERCMIQDFVLPHFVIYEANAAHLDRLGAPLQQKIAYLFDRWAALPKEIDSLKYFWNHAAGGRATYTMRLQEEVNQTLILADDILLALRPIASPRSRAKHLT